ncbi:DUF5078 domain-containing protein [Mycolicibacterium sp. XJ870]
MRKKFIGTCLAAAAAATTLVFTPGVAAADATDEYPIPSNMLKTTCTVDQYMAAVRDTNPVYYERYMIDYNNKPAADQQGARDRINWFFSMDYAGRRQYSENMATNAFFEQMSWRWPNWAKLFFNNKGVVAHGTEHCPTYPPSDPSVWTW